MFLKIIKHAGIGRKLITYILLFSSLVTFLGTSLQLYLDYDHDIKSIQNTMGQIESSYLKSISSNVWYINDQQVTILLDGILRLPHMQHLEIRQNGEQLIFVGQPQLSNIIQREFPLSFTFKGQDNKLGVLKATASLTGIYKQLWKKTAVILSTQAVKTFLVSAFILYIFYILVGRHLMFMADYVRRLDLKLSTPLILKRLPPSNNDELETLVQSINVMRRNIAEEIGERMQAEEALKETAVINKKIISESPVGISIYDEFGQCIESNESMGKIVGATKEQLLKQNYNEIESWKKSGLLKTAKHAIKDGRTKRHVLEVTSTFGKDLHIDCFLVPFLKENRNNLMLMITDITERILEAEKYKKTIESSIDGFWVIDKKGNFLEVNQAYSSMIGYSRNELLNRTVMDVEAKEHPEEIKKRIEKIVKNGSDRFESKHRHKKGHIIDVEVSTTFTQDNGGMFYVFLRNITEKNQMEERLRQAQKMESIGNLAGGIAHDFNNLLYPIIGMSEMLLEDLPSDSLDHENAQEIFNAGRRAGDLVKQILAFSRQSEHKMTAIRLQNILREVLKLSRSTLPANIELHENIHQNCGLVMADPTQIHQIAMNLITNAFHAVEEKNGVIDIELKEITLEVNELPDSALLTGRYVRLSVSDNGIGMAQATINSVFEPYFTTKEKGKGTGLGLAVVYGIVKEHNGDIKVYSELGEGSTFNIYLPLMEKTPKTETADQIADIETGTEKILLVDDEESVAKLESKMLSRLGYLVTGKTKSSEALNIFKMNPENFDLVITDMTMPDMTGDQLAKEILSIKPNTPIIICTGFSERINKEQAEIIGVKGFLMKPVVKSDLAQMVRKILDEAKNL